MKRGLRGLQTCSAAGNRTISAGVVASYLVAAMICVPDAARRAELHYTIVLTLGYGHLVSALTASYLRGPPPGQRPAPRYARTIAAWGGVLAGFVMFTQKLAAEPLFTLSLLAIAALHTAENDLALGHAYERGGRIGRHSRSPDDWLAALGITWLILSASGMALALGLDAAEATPLPVDAAWSAWMFRGLALLAGIVLVARERGRRNESLGLALIGTSILLDASILERFGIAFGDVFAASTGYHLVSWLVLSVQRARLAGAAREARRLLAATHIGPIALALTCSTVETPATAAVRAAFFAPAPYLYWSIAHVVHTATLRERRARGARDQSTRRADSSRA